jgi:60 kDa SS-A/Ro ribonucleoprotein
MSLATYARHGVFGDAELVRLVAARLANADEVRKAKAFPYQLLVAWKTATRVPAPISEALQDAMEHSVVRRRNPKAKLVCIDLTPNVHKQAIDREDVLNVGGFSDAVFDVVADFVKLGRGAHHWAETIERIEI